MASMEPDQEKPGVAFMGTPEFAVPTLRHLVQQGFPVKAVVTGADKPRGRGYAQTPSPVKQAALAAELAVWQPADVNAGEFLSGLRQAAPDVLVVVAFGQILKAGVLELPPWGCVNLHGSLLPRYRGAAPIQWAIARGETKTGITVQKMALKVNSGPILVQREIPIGPDETAAEVGPRLAEMGGPAVAEALMMLKASHGQAGSEQDEAQVTWAPRLVREDGRIQWDWPTADIHNRVRGFNPWPGTDTLAKGERLKILRTRRSEEAVAMSVAPGTVVRLDPERGWLVATGEGATLWVAAVQGANTKVMKSQAYTNGYRFGVGDRLG